MLKLSSLFPGLLLGILASPTSAQEMPTLLQRALNRAATLRYTGERSIAFKRDGNLVETQEIVTRDGDRLRIEYPEGSRMAGQIVVEVGMKRRQYIPGKNEIRIQPARREESLDRLRGFLKWLRARGGTVGTGPSERIAGLVAGQIVFRDESGNVMQRLFIDPSSGAVLKRNLYDPGGAPVGSMVFTRIQIGEHANPALFRLVRKGARIVTPSDELTELIARGGFANVRLPNAELEFARIIPTGDSPTLLQVYAVGGERVSLFQTKGELDPNRLRHFRGPDLKTRAWSDDGRNFALIGTLNDKALDRWVAILRTRT